MEILQRPHPTFPSMAEMVCVNAKGKDVHLLTVCDFSREQAKRMRKELEEHAFAYVAKYCNGGLPTDLDAVLEIIKARKVPRSALHLQKDRSGRWMFWGDVGEVEGFCFLILAQEVVYKVMASIQLPIDSQLQLFMSCHPFKATPSIKDNVVYFRAEGEPTTPLPEVFEPKEAGGWHIPALGVSLSIKDSCIELVKQLFPTVDRQQCVTAAV